MGVDLPGQGGDVLAQCRCEAGVLVGERECLEAAGFVVARVVADAECSASCQRPRHVYQVRNKNGVRARFRIGFRASAIGLS